MATVEGASSATGGTGATGAGARGTGGGMSFRAFLSDINPLQYIPVVGAVYRAVTGDEGNGTLRFVASLGTSFALGGPLGLGITMAEKITGIDPERIARSMLSHVLHHGAAAATDTATGAATAIANTPAAGAADRPWSAAELSAYATATNALPATGAGGSVGADTLNAMELQRVSALYA